jgi:hypothetical protein
MTNQQEKAVPKIKRYQPKACGYGLESHPAELVECTDGPAVLYKDYAALESQLRGCERMREALQFYIDAEDTLNAEDSYATAAVYTKAMGKFEEMARAALNASAPKETDDAISC